MAINVKGLLSGLAGLPNAIGNGLLGPMPTNPGLGIDPQSLAQSRQQALSDLAMGLMAGDRRAPGAALMAATQNARQGYQGRVFDMLKEQEIARMQEQRKAGDAYIQGLPEGIRGAAQVAGPQAVAQAQIESMLTPQEQPWRVLTPEEEAQTPGLDPALIYKTNGKDIEVLGGRPPAPTIGSISVGGEARGLPDYLKQRQIKISDQLATYEEKAGKSFAAVQRLDALIDQSRKAQLTGSLAPGVMGTGEFLRSFGIDLAPEALTDARALDSMINQNHMQWVADLGGARGMTDSENKKLAQALVRVQDSIPARVEVATLLRNAEKRQYEQARAAAKRKEAQLIDIEQGGKGFSTFEDVPDAPVAPKYVDGQTATGPGGKKLVYRNGKGWVPQ